MSIPSEGNSDITGKITPPVPAEKVPVPGSIDKIAVKKGRERSYLSGHPISSHDLFNNWGKIRMHLRPVVGSEQRLEMVMKVMKIQATKGLCFASAGYLALGVGSEKTWDRCLARLRKWGLAKTERTYRGWQQSVNLIDLRLLWRWVMKVIKTGRHNFFERVGDRLWCKLVGVWKEVKEEPPWIPSIPQGKAKNTGVVPVKVSPEEGWARYRRLLYGN